MAESGDRERWNDRYRAGGSDSAPLLLGRDLHLLPRAGRALDVAGGSGGAAAILAARGLDVTVVDISDVALDQARRSVVGPQMRVTTVRADLTVEPLPAGPWDLICCFNYLDRSLFPAFIEGLAPGGMLAVAIATRSNLERHDRPGPHFCLDDGELPTLLGDLELVRYRQGWNLEGRHLAEAIARRT